jgi:hypothetical protein
LAKAGPNLLKKFNTNNKFGYNKKGPSISANFLARPDSLEDH